MKGKFIQRTVSALRRFLRSGRRLFWRMSSECSGQNGLSILMVKSAPRRSRAGAEMFFASTLKTCLRPFGHWVDIGVPEFWNRRLHYDIIHIHWPHWLVRTKRDRTTAEDVEEVRQRLAELKSQGTAIVYTRHNEIPHWNANPYDIALCRLVEDESDRVIHMGRTSIARMTAGRGSRDVLIPHHGFDKYPVKGKAEARRRLGLSPEERVVAAVGVYREKRERQLVLEVCQSARIPGLRLLSPGLFKPFRGEASENFLTWRRQLGDIYPRQSEGWITVEEMADCLSAADIVFIQRVQVLNSGNLPLGFHFGKVVVGPDRGNVGEILQETGNPVFDPDDPVSVVEALKKGLELAERGKGDENARYAQQNWNLDLFAEAHDKLYRSLHADGRND